MGELSIIGIDLAKTVFQVHGAATDGSVLFRRKLSRGQVLSFLSKQPLCIVAMEACASAHFWGREIEPLGHSVRLIPPAYVKPYVKRQKNDAADAEAIVEAASRPGMRFVAIKTPEQQARAMIFRTSDLLVRQRTQLINALRGHLGEHGLVAAQGTRQVKKLEQAIEEDDGTLPPLVCEIGRACLDQIADLSSRIDLLTKELRRHASGYQTTVLLQSIPGIGPITALAIDAFAPPLEDFRRGRAFSAWLGLVPRQHSTGGKERLGRVSKMGQRDIRRLLITGAMAVIRWAQRRGAPEGSWLQRMLAKKPVMLVAIALANKMARVVWAVATRNERYRDLTVVA